MRIENVFSYRNLQHEWVSQICNCIKEIPVDIFFEQDGAPLRREVTQLDSRLFQKLIGRFGPNVEQNVRTMLRDNQFEIDIVLPTEPKTLIEIEKGKLPRLELDIMKIGGSICRSPSEYGYGCIVVPANYIQLNLAGRRSPYAYATNNLIPLNRPLLDLKNREGNFLLKDFVVIGYRDPRE